MPKWADRIREIAARNPDALPPWMRGGRPDKAWYSTDWQADAELEPEDSARPVLLVLEWLCRRGQLTRQGAAVLKNAQEGKIGSLSITASMVQPKAAAFLDSQWDQWFDSHGIHLILASDSIASASAALDDCWATFGKGQLK